MSERRTTRDRLRIAGAETARLLGCLAYTGLLFAPHAVNKAIEDSSVSTEIVGVPTTLRFSPNQSRLGLLNQVNFYTDTERYGVGIGADVTGFPRIESSDQLKSYLSPKRLDIYTSLADSPQQAVSGPVRLLAEEATDNAFEYERSRIGWGFALYAGLGASRLYRRVRELEGETAPELTRTMLLGSAVCLVAVSLTSAEYDRQQWLDTAVDTSELAAVNELASTSLSDVRTDNPAVINGISNSLRYVGVLKERRQAFREQYVAAAAPELTRQIELLEPLRPDETLLFSGADYHASRAGIELARTATDALQQRYGAEALQTGFNLGDTLYDPLLQRGSLQAQATIIKGGTIILNAGNHDYGQTVQFARDAGMVVANGRADANGLTVYGEPDPKQTPFLQPSRYVSKEVDEQTVGERAYDATTARPVDAINLHEPQAIEALLGIDDIRSYLETSQSLTTCEPNDGPREVAAAMIDGGHWHTVYTPKIICYDDGRYTFVNVQGSAGGAEEASTPNRWSDPDGAPIKPVHDRVIIFNTTTRLVTGYIDIVIESDATVQPITRTDVGTPSGQPFSVSR